MVHRSVIGEFKLGHKRPWSSVHLVNSSSSNDSFQYFLSKDYLENVFKKYFLRKQGYFFDSLGLKTDGTGAVVVVYLYKSRLNFKMKRFTFGTKKFYRRRRFIPKAKFRGTIRRKNIFMKFLWQVERFISFMRWLIRGKMLGLVLREATWGDILIIVNLMFFWINAGLDRIKILKNKSKLFWVYRSLQKFILLISFSLKRLLRVGSVKIYFRFIRERNVGSSVLARYMAHRLSGGYPIHIVFGFVLKQLRRKYKRLKYNDLFGTERANCLGYHFRLSGRLSRRLRAKTMNRRAGKLYVSNHSWVPNYESVQVKTKYGTCGLRVWMLYRFSSKRGSSITI